MIKTTKPPMAIYGGNANTFTNSFFSFYKYNATYSDSQSGFVRVSKKNPCQICGKPDYCTYTKDGNLALCMRVSAGSIKTAKNNAFIHVLNAQPNHKEVSAHSAQPIKKSGNSGKSESEDSHADHLNQVYTFLLEECLTLNGNHAEQLRVKRDLSDTTIAAKLYASVPTKSGLQSVNQKMREKFGDQLKGVAGFYKDEWERIWKIQLASGGGFFVPYRNEKGLISGLQIRNDDESTKYIWFSTNPEYFNEGTSSGAPLHFTLPDLVKETGEIVITEGALKADCFSERTGKPCVALAGVTGVNFENLSSRIKKVFPELQKVIIAYDADWKQNDSVRKALIRLSRSLKRSGFEVVIWDWDIKFGKGIDDLAANEIREVENE
jgi:hypothetical protein